MIVERFLSYADREENIRAAFIVGSRARREKPADQYSDLDMVILAKDPDLLLHHKEWLNQLGKVYITFLEETPVGGGLERRVLFDAGLDVDFACFPLSSLQAIKSNPQLLSVLSKGFEILIDKDTILPTVEDTNKSNLVQKERTEEIENMVHDFWYHAALTAKKLCRGELLQGKIICDTYMKDLLVTLIRAQARLKNGVEYETWHGYRFFEEWADPEVVAKFTKIYSHYRENDVWRALIETMNLFREVSMEVYALKELSYPDENIHYVNQLIDTYYLQRRQIINK